MLSVAAVIVTFSRAGFITLAVIARCRVRRHAAARSAAAPRS